MCRHVPNRPAREVLTVINYPPPLILVKVASSRYTGSYPHGSRVNYMCDSELKSGSLTMECVTGNWSSPPPECCEYKPYDTGQ